MKAEPIYIAHNLHPAYQLRYGWTGWPSQETFPSHPPAPFISELAEQWKGDGLHLLEHNWTPQCISITFSATPEVSPILLAARAKGRLQYALRIVGNPVKFSRKVSVRSIGHNTRETVETYVRTQIDREEFADPLYEAMIKSQVINDPTVDLSQPKQTNSGNYWYNLHLVLVVAERYRMGWGNGAKDLPPVAREIAEENGYEISTLSAMPDHLHIALRGNVEHTPQDIALTFQNILAHELGQCRIWEHNYYVGTFGEYTMRAVRK